VATEELTGPPQSLLVNRMMVDAVVHTPNGAHFTSCVPDYGRDEDFQREYTQTPWEEFHAKYLAGSEEDYQAAIA
jgi:glutaconate CoA-transferase subunit A